MDLPKRKVIQHQTESVIGDILLRELNLLGVYPIPQFKVGNYRIDLALPDKMVAIECDGKEWHSSEEQMARDDIRDKYLKDNGWQVIRLTGSDIYKWADDIARILVGKKAELEVIRDGYYIRGQGYHQDETLMTDEELDEMDLEQEEQESIEDNMPDKNFIKVGDVLKTRLFGLNA